MKRTTVLSKMLIPLVLSAASFAGCGDDFAHGQPAEGAEAPPSPGEPDGGTPAPAPVAPSPAAAEATGGLEPAPMVVQSGFDIDPGKTLLIRDPAIVDNATRTLDPCDARRRGIARGPVTSTQTWTFGHLMTQMANGRDPAVFAHNWLANWAISTRFGDDRLIALRGRDSNTTLPGRIYDAWQRESGGSAGGTVQLAMNRAPFRLLAIVNRFDLRKNRRFNEGNSGELRFVFSVLDLDHVENAPNRACLQAGSIDAPSAPLGDQLLILEFAVDHMSDSARRTWIGDWITLGSLEFTDPNFGITLERLTQSVVRAGAGGSRPNGSALIRLRTNESTDAVHWDLREFTINASTGYLVADTVKQTPKADFSPQVVEDGLVTWFSTNGTPVLNDTHRVPDQFLGSHSTNQASNSTWLFALQGAGIDPMVGYEFSRRTCVGCHSADTGASFFHVHGRPFRQAPAEISHFLDGAYPPDPESGLPTCPQDPNGQSRCFNEFADRSSDILSYLNGGG